MKKFYMPERDRYGRFKSTDAETINNKVFCRDFRGRFAPWRNAWKYKGVVGSVGHFMYRLNNHRSLTATAARQSE